ncbi:MAG: ribonuclease E activity regulator RraA [Phenylobacterium sp.]|uniref:ribonuclease E activity regulator RraA n=1 Tax=Phenylobacterium sp. TaxID=1871053 RepID=UPI0025D02C48|nr:ribonuclease E activity regulator RraA [Phenylobacterium sp.]MCG9915368.1 ribonuclease E activity regulator RraA [Phenylobacterium sp.]
MSEAPSTADLSDENEGRAQVLRLQLRDLGGRRTFSGLIRTVRCHEDNSKVKAILATPGHGAVLVVDGGGSLNCALVGDLIAQSAVDHGWAGVVVNGAVRDAPVLATLDLGVKALGTMPLRSVRRDLGEADVPVAFGGVIFKPGDRLFADGDGVVVLPA